MAMGAVLIIALLFLYFNYLNGREHVTVIEQPLNAHLPFHYAPMAATPATKNSVHWAPSPVPSPFSDTSSASASSISTTSTSAIQYVNAQLISHGFAVSPGLSLDGLSSADAEGVTKCLLSMLGQRVVSGAIAHSPSPPNDECTNLPFIGRHDTCRGPDDETSHTLL